MVAIGGVTVGDEPAEKGLADQGREFLLRRLPMRKTTAVAVTATHIHIKAPR